MITPGDDFKWWGVSLQELRVVEGGVVEKEGWVRDCVKDWVGIEVQAVLHYLGGWSGPV